MIAVRCLPASILLILALCGCPAGTQSTQQPTAQAPTLVYDDHAYEPQFRTVQFYRAPDPNLPAIAYLNDPNPAPIVLEFDELLPQEVMPGDLYLSFIACDADWTPASLLPMEYLDGFTSDRIWDWTRSANTRIPYVHYRYVITPENFRFKRSGNYLLKVWRGQDEDNVVLTRRFLVADRRLGLEMLLDQSRGASVRNRFQRLDFSIYPGSLPLTDPRMELEVVVMQNHRWETAVRGIQPTFFSPDKYEYQFDAGHYFTWAQEFRRMDTRSTRFRGLNMEAIEDRDSVWAIRLRTDKIRRDGDYVAIQDQNGGYAIGVQEMPDAAISADYVLTRFTLAAPAPLDTGRVWVTGRLTDWGRMPEAEMVYDAAGYRYQTEILLKQGYYDYAYAILDSAGGWDERGLEGFWPQPENAYTVLVYYRPLNARCAELVAMSQVNFNFR